MFEPYKDAFSFFYNQYLDDPTSYEIKFIDYSLPNLKEAINYLIDNHYMRPPVGIGKITGDLTPEGVEFLKSVLKND